MKHVTKITYSYSTSWAYIIIVDIVWYWVITTFTSNHFWFSRVFFLDIHYNMIGKLVITQGICIFLLFNGIAIEIIYGADLGYLLITGGSAIFAVTTKIENYLLTKRKDK